MVMSANGSFIDNKGSSRALSGPEDMRIFNFLRSQSDVVLVGAGTARSEKYGQIQIREEFTDFARCAQPTVAVISAGLDLWTGARLFNEPGARPLIYTRKSLDSDWVTRLSALSAVAEVIALDIDSDDFLMTVTRHLHDRGLMHILCEGGPTLLRAALAAGLVDDVCLTHSPALSNRSPDSELLELLEPFAPEYEIITESFRFTRAFAPEIAQS